MINTLTIVGTPYVIRHQDFLLSPEGVSKVSKEYNASYLGEFCLVNKHGDWINRPASFFYTQEKHPEGSNYFAITMGSFGETLITDGIVLETCTILANMNAETNQGVYSAYRHDYQVIDGTMIDGGRDYTKCSANKNEFLLAFNVKDGKFIMSPHQPGLKLLK